MPKQENTSLDIVIPTRGRGQLIVPTVSTILQNNQTNFNLWIIDQSDDDSTEKAVQPFADGDSRVHYLRTATKGSNIARNIGISVGAAPYILFTDDDCTVTPDWIEHMVWELQNGAWAVFGQVIPKHQDESTTVDKMPKENLVSHEQLPMAVQENQVRQIYQKNRFNLGFGHGANMGLSRYYIDLIGGFDNLLGAGGALPSWPERDLGYRILHRGGRIVYTPMAIIYHRHWRDWAEVKRTFRNYGIGAGAVVGKYIRCGDLLAVYLFIEWIVDQGLRPIASGIFKRRSKEKIVTGYYQLIYPWVGLIRGLRYPVNRSQFTYISETYDGVPMHSFVQPLDSSSSKYDVVSGD